MGKEKDNAKYKYFKGKDCKQGIYTNYARKKNINTLNTKINGRAYFNTDEIEKICKELDITEAYEFKQIFLG